MFSSMRVFPYKVRVTEDRVAKDLFHLQLSPPNHYQRRQRTLSEIESSLTLDSDSEDERRNDEEVKFKISDEFRKEIDEFRKNILQKNPQSEISSSRPDVSKALVIWTPPLIPLPPRVKIEKDNCNSKTDTAEKPISNSMDVQFEPDFSSNAHDLNKNYSSVSSFTTSNESDKVEYDDAMEL